MHILIIEDEVMVGRRLRRFLEEILEDQITTIAHEETLLGATAYLEQYPVDLVFVDLNLKGEDGFEVLSSASIQAFQTIIVSANTNQALRSYEYDILDFVSKPVTKDRLVKALDRYKPLPKNAGRGARKFIKIRYGNKHNITPVEQVMFISGGNKYSELYLQTSETHLHEKKLWQFMLVLPPQFQRIHKSHIVNLDYANKLITLSGRQHELHFKNGHILPVGRSFLVDLHARLD